MFQPPFHIEFDKQQDEFTAERRDSVCQFANVSPPRIAFGQKERLLSTLLPVRMLPKWLYHAPTLRSLVQVVLISGFGGNEEWAEEAARALAQPFAARRVLRQIVAPPSILHFA